MSEIKFSIRLQGSEETIKSIQAIDLQLNKLKNSQQQLKKELKGVDSNAPEYKKLSDELSKVESRSRILRTEKSKLNRELRNSQNVLNSVGSSYNNLAAQTNLLKAQLRALPDGFSKTNKEAEALKKQIIANTNELKRFDKEALGESYRNVGNYSSALGGLKSSFTALFGVTVGVTALAQGFRQLANESIDLATKVSGVEQAFNRIADPGLLDNLRESVRGTVSDLNLMAAAVNAENFNIPLSEMGTLLEFASKRAEQTGKSVDGLVESIITGIGRKSPLVLDNLGISAVELREKLNGVGIESASIADITRIVSDIAKRELGEMGDVAETAATKIARNKAELENTSAVLGEKLIPFQLAYNKAKVQFVDLLTTAVIKSLTFANILAGIPKFLYENKEAVGALIIALISLNAQNIATAASTLKARAAQLVSVSATRAVTAAQWLWNAAMTANPIGLIVAAIAIFIGGLFTLYRRVEIVRKSVDTLWAGLKRVGNVIEDLLVPTANAATREIDGLGKATEETAGKMERSESKILSYHDKLKDLKKTIEETGTALETNADGTSKSLKELNEDLQELNKSLDDSRTSEEYAAGLELIAQKQEQINKITGKLNKSQKDSQQETEKLKQKIAQLNAELGLILPSQDAYVSKLQEIANAYLSAGNFSDAFIAQVKATKAELDNIANGVDADIARDLNEGLFSNLTLAQQLSQELNDIANTSLVPEEGVPPGVEAYNQAMIERRDIVAETKVAEEELNEVIRMGISSLADQFSTLAEEGSATQKILFAISKAAAIASIIIDNQKTIAGLTVGAAPYLIGPTGPAAAALLATQILTSKLKAGIAIATIAAQTIPAFIPKKTKKAARGADLQVLEGGTVPTRGGIIKGRSHAQGGVRLLYKGKHIEVEGGEFWHPDGYVINKRSTREFSPVLHNMLSGINSYRNYGTRFNGSTKSFMATGGVLGPTPVPTPINRSSTNVNVNMNDLRNDIRNLTRSMDERIDRIEIILDTEKTAGAIDQHKKQTDQNRF